MFFKIIFLFLGIFIFIYFYKNGITNFFLFSVLYSILLLKIIFRK